MAALVSLEVLTKHLFIILTNSLKLSGDVRLNPRPYWIIKSVQRSFNQGRLALLAEITGRQNAL